MERLKQRAEFLAVSRGIKVPVSAFVLQARCRGDAGPPRFGFTVARTVGNAVERNRVRRRLKEMVRTAGMAVESGHDYVVIGRRTALVLPFGQLRAEFERALDLLRAGGQERNVGRRASRRPTDDETTR